MKLVDADKMREWLRVGLQRAEDGAEVTGLLPVNKHRQIGKACTYASVLRYLSVHEYDEGLTITHGEHGWFCEDDRGDIHGWDRESKQAAIDLYRKRRRMADAANRSGNPRS